MATNGEILPAGWSIEGIAARTSPSLAPPAELTPTPSPKPRFFNPIMNMLSPPIIPAASPKKLRAIEATRSLLLHGCPAPKAPEASSRSPRGQRICYRSQLDFKTAVFPRTPAVTPPKPPRCELRDSTAAKDTQYTASSRMGHGLIGVFARCTLPYSPATPRKLCEYRSERGNTRDFATEHAEYIRNATSTKNIVVRGHKLVNGTQLSLILHTHTGKPSFQPLQLCLNPPGGSHLDHPDGANRSQ